MCECPSAYVWAAAYQRKPWTYFKVPVALILEYCRLKYTFGDTLSSSTNLFHSQLRICMVSSEGFPDMFTN